MFPSDHALDARRKALALPKPTQFRKVIVNATSNQ